MTQRVRQRGFFSNRNARRARMLLKMSAMRAGKARKRQERIDAGLLEREPKMERWNRFEYGIRDRFTGETHWREFVSVRQASKALGLIMKYV